MNLTGKLKNPAAIEIALFCALLAIMLLPIWQNKFFLTQDGPCHLYNSKLWFDCAMGRNFDFFCKFYQINPNFNPNWCDHLALGSFMLLFPPLLSEKILLSLYIILFPLFLRMLLKTIKYSIDVFILSFVPVAV